MPVCLATSSVPDGHLARDLRRTIGRLLERVVPADALHRWRLRPRQPLPHGDRRLRAPDMCLDDGPLVPVPDGALLRDEPRVRRRRLPRLPWRGSGRLPSANPCALTAAISCGSGVPVCTATSFQPDGTTCGTGLTCQPASALSERVAWRPEQAAADT